MDATDAPARSRPPISEEELRGALRSANGSRTEAARLLGVTRKTVHKWMARYGITVRQEVD